MTVDDAARATRRSPQDAAAWQALGEALLAGGRSDEAARAFDRAIGLGPASARALWGGALAHAERGRTVIARHYLEQALGLQPSWVELALATPPLAPLLGPTARLAARLRTALGPLSIKTLQHADGARALQVGRVVDVPSRGSTTYVSLGLCEHAWPAPAAPRLELLLLSNLPAGPSARVVGNAAFHLMAGPLPPRPGALLEGVIGALGLDGISARLPHLYLAEPRPWSLPTPFEAGPPAIALLHAVPVGDAEARAWRSLGADAFEAALGAAGADIGDLERDDALG